MNSLLTTGPSADEGADAMRIVGQRTGVRSRARYCGYETPDRLRFVILQAWHHNPLRLGVWWHLYVALKVCFNVWFVALEGSPSTLDRMLRDDFLCLGTVLYAMALTFYNFHVARRHRHTIVTGIQTLIMLEKQWVSLGGAPFTAGGPGKQLILLMRTPESTRQCRDNLQQRTRYEQRVTEPLYAAMAALLETEQRVVQADPISADLGLGGGAGAGATMTVAPAANGHNTHKFTILGAMLQESTTVYQAFTEAAPAFMDIHTIFTYFGVTIVITARYAGQFGYWAILPSVAFNYVLLALYIGQQQNPYAALRSDTDFVMFHGDAVVGSFLRTGSRGTIDAKLTPLFGYRA